MASQSGRSNEMEIATEKGRLESVFQSYDQEKITHLLKTSRLGREGSRSELIDCLVRFDLRRTFGAEAALWDVATDNDPSRGSLVPRLEYDESFDDITTRTNTGEYTHVEDPAFNSTVKENSEQPTQTTSVVSTVTLATNSSLVFSSASTYSTGYPPRAYDAIYRGLAARLNDSVRLNQPRSVMSTGASLNQSGMRDRIMDSQNQNSQYLYNPPRAQSTMYHPSENNRPPHTQTHIPGDGEHYTQYLYQDQQSRQPIGTHILNRQLPPFTKAPHVNPANTLQTQMARVHFENQSLADTEQLINLNRPSRIETNQLSHPSRTEPDLPVGVRSQLQGSVPQSAGETNTQPATNHFLSSQIGYQSSINQKNPLGLDEAKRCNNLRPGVENARSLFAGQNPYQGVDGSFGCYPPNVGYQWPYPPMLPQQGYVPPMPYGQAYGQSAFPLDFRNASQNDPRYISFPHPSGIDMSRRSSSLDTTFQRETRRCNLLQKWQVSFSGGYKGDVEEFIERIKECQQSLSVTDGEILRLIPSILSGAARFWARPLSQNWNSITDFFAALRLQYGVPDFQARLEEEIRARTQGPEEPISSFISNMRLLLDKVVPRMTLEAQLEKTYRNLHPSLYRFIFREQFKTFEELQILGQREEVRRVLRCNTLYYAHMCNVCG